MPSPSPSRRPSAGSSTDDALVAVGTVKPKELVTRYQRLQAYSLTVLAVLKAAQWHRVLRDRHSLSIPSLILA